MAHYNIIMFNLCVIHHINYTPATNNVRDVSIQTVTEPGAGSIIITY